jgi:hypothetical protein
VKQFGLTNLNLFYPEICVPFSQPERFHIKVSRFERRKPVSFCGVCHFFDTGGRCIDEIYKKPNGFLNRSEMIAGLLLVFHFTTQRWFKKMETLSGFAIPDLLGERKQFPFINTNGMAVVNGYWR